MSNYLCLYSTVASTWKPQKLPLSCLWSHPITYTLVPEIILQLLSDASMYNIQFTATKFTFLPIGE